MIDASFEINQSISWLVSQSVNKSSTINSAHFQLISRIKDNLTILLKSPAWAASRKLSFHSSVLSTLFGPYFPQLLTLEMDACTLEILAFLNNCSLRWGEEALLSNSMPFVTVCFSTLPLDWNALDAEPWLAVSVCDSRGRFLVEALFSSCANSAWMLSREAVLATEL